jgi:hypothetical protein
LRSCPLCFSFLIEQRPDEVADAEALVASEGLHARALRVILQIDLQDHAGSARMSVVLLHGWRID